MTRLDQAFEFRSPEALVFGRGCVTKVGERTSALGDRALVVTDPGIREAGLLNSVLDSLERADVSVAVFDDVEADPRVATADTAATNATDVDAVVGIGGGSSMDVAKAAALAAGSGRSVEELLSVEGALQEGKPAILIPTTAGTGSEVSPAAVLRDENGEKHGFVDDALFAALALVDPDLTRNLPPNLTAATGIDAFAHAVGSYISTTTNELADALCRRAMELIESNLRAATFRGSNCMSARVAMSMAATMAMLGRVNGGKSAIHSVAYGVQAVYDVPHAEAIALVMPGVLEYNAPAAADELAALGTALYDARGGRRDRAAALVDGVRQLRADLDLPESLGEVGGSEADLDELAELSVHSKRHLQTNPRPMSSTDARTVLTKLL